MPRKSLTTKRNPPPPPKRISTKARRSPVGRKVYGTKVVNFHPPRTTYHPLNVGYTRTPRRYPKDIAAAKLKETLKKLTEMKRLGLIDPNTNLSEFGIEPAALSSNTLLSSLNGEDKPTGLSALFNRLNDGVYTGAERREKDDAVRAALSRAMFDVLAREGKRQADEKAKRWGLDHNYQDPSKALTDLKDTGGWSFKSLKVPSISQITVPMMALPNARMTAVDFEDKKRMLREARRDEFKQFHLARKGVLPPSGMVDRAFPKNVEPLGEEEEMLLTL